VVTIHSFHRFAQKPQFSRREGLRPSRSCTGAASQNMLPWPFGQKPSPLHALGNVAEEVGVFGPESTLESLRPSGRGGVGTYPRRRGQPDGCTALVASKLQ
jgi:hypothetical protein